MNGWMDMDSYLSLGFSSFGDDLFLSLCVLCGKNSLFLYNKLHYSCYKC
jgi:hypothetical protein